MPAPTHREPEAERTSPSLSGVSTPDERAKPTPTTAAKQPIKMSAFLSLLMSDAKFIVEKINVTATVTARIAIANDTNGDTELRSPIAAAILISSSPAPIIRNKKITPNKPKTALIILIIF